jgi:hypothetical protein
MKNLILALLLLVGVTASIPAEANHRRAVGATRSAHGVGHYIGGWGWYTCPWGTQPRYFFGGGYYTSYSYVYPYGYVQQLWWIPGPGVYCVP